MSSSTLLLLPVLGVDCEMAQGSDGRNVLVRATVIDGRGSVLFDSVCRPKEWIADYRTRIHGITHGQIDKAPDVREVLTKLHIMLRDFVRHDHHRDANSLSVESTSAAVADASSGAGVGSTGAAPHPVPVPSARRPPAAIVVGHNVSEDLRLLRLNQAPWTEALLVRDTAQFTYYQKYSAQRGGGRVLHHSAAGSTGNGYSPSPAPARFLQRKLKDLALEVLHVEIQQGAHDSVNDAAASLLLYLSARDIWEQELVKCGHLATKLTDMKIYEPRCSMETAFVRCLYHVPFLVQQVAGFGSTISKAKSNAMSAAWTELSTQYTSTVLPVIQARAHEYLQDEAYAFRQLLQQQQQQQQQQHKQHRQ